MNQPRPIVENSEDLMFKNSRLADLVELWREKRRGRKMPSRGDFDPLELPAAVWPHLLLIDVLRVAGLRFRYRLVGTHIVETLGRDATGRQIDEMQDPADYDNFVEGYRWVAENARPLRRSGSAMFVNKDWVAFESPVLPLSADDREVNMLLAPIVFTSVPAPDAALLPPGPDFHRKQPPHC